MAVHSGRIGTWRMLEILERIVEGKGEDGDIEKLETLAKNIKAPPWVRPGSDGLTLHQPILRYFRDEYEAYIKEKCCSGASMPGAQLCGSPTSRGRTPVRQGFTRPGPLPARCASKRSHRCN